MTKLVESVASIRASDINRVLTCFYDEINPATNFGNKTQRKAVEFLLERVGIEKLIPVVQSLKASNLEKYAPKIYTPLELKMKWAALVDHWKRKETEKPKPRFVDLTDR